MPTSSTVAVRTSEGRGEEAFALCSFAEGELVLADRPIAAKRVMAPKAAGRLGTSEAPQDGAARAPSGLLGSTPKGSGSPPMQASAWPTGSTQAEQHQTTVVMSMGAEPKAEAA
mmetsp:Transcript_84600/g.215365  ORF Transcript_84600/g.215365 Transcript_84600/m.215365 type:complete len:114 (-) Transcript_84600:120-461(-)